MVDLRQTKDYAKYMESIGWIAERHDGINYFIKKFPLIGSFIKIQRPEKIDYRYIDVLAVKYKAHRIVVEPKIVNRESYLINHGFKLSTTPYLPSKTIHIDLTKSEKTLLKEMHYKTRYNIKKTQMSKLKCQNSKDIEQFATFWQKCALKQRGMFLSQRKSIINLYNAFGKNAHIILVTPSLSSRAGEESEAIPSGILSGILLLCTKDIAYYMYAASSTEGKKLFAPTLAVWEAIKLAKKQRCKVFDFEGIYDERFPLKSWQGFTRFKKSFGGHEFEYPGAYVKTRLPL